MPARIKDPLLSFAEILLPFSLLHSVFGCHSVQVAMHPFLSYCLNWLFRLGLAAALPQVCKWLLVKYLLPPDLDGSEPLDQWTHRIIGYFPGNLLAMFTYALVDTWKPTVF